MKSTRLVCCFTAVLIATALGQEATTPEPDIRKVSDEERVATLGRSPFGVTVLAFSSDGGSIVSVSKQDVRTWDVASRQEKGAVNGLGGRVAAVSPDGRSIAIAGRQNVTLNDATSGLELLSIEPHGDGDSSAQNSGAP